VQTLTQKTHIQAYVPVFKYRLADDINLILVKKRPGQNIPGQVGAIRSMIDSLFIFLPFTDIMQ
jgi:hypothetical protein